MYYKPIFIASILSTAHLNPVNGLQIIDTILQRAERPLAGVAIKAPAHSWLHPGFY
jgi:hypothetical protein